ncbi:hypothetical protein [Methylomonas sp. DH-1]|uniref:hypothetical protein n=1 Tax=Methylomonas sp. (strain DH-1) TaxID=1727196 RepID=UPI000A878437|nr:hypothetical protein [Methylomonas sp. DH-1]
MKTILFVILSSYLSVAIARTRPHETEQEVLNRVAVKTDTIFKGRVLRTKTIPNGIVYSDGDNSNAAVIEVEILEVYRGNLHQNNKQVLCTWTSQRPDPAISFPKGEDQMFFGVMGESGVILIPNLYGYFLLEVENESRLYKALKLKTEISKDLFLSENPENKLIRNACYEPIKWE